MRCRIRALATFVLATCGATMALVQFEPQYIACDATDGLTTHSHSNPFVVHYVTTYDDMSVCACDPDVDTEYFVPWLGPTRRYDGTCTDGKCNHVEFYGGPWTSCTHVRMWILGGKCLVNMHMPPIFPAELLCPTGTECPIKNEAPIDGTIVDTEFEDCEDG